MRFGIDWRVTAIAAPSREQLHKCKPRARLAPGGKLLLYRRIRPGRLLSYPAVVSFITHCGDQSAHTGTASRAVTAIYFRRMFTAARLGLSGARRRRLEGRAARQQGRACAARQAG